MRVLLLRPNSIIVSTPVPLGLGYLAQALREKGGHEVKILDARLLRLSPDRVLEIAREFGPALVGISSLSFDAGESHRVAKLLKSELPSVKVVVGGPYASARGEPILDDPAFDFIAIGEGETTIVELAEALEGKRAISDVAGIMGRDDEGRLFRNAPRPPEEDLDGLLVAWDLLGPENYFSPWARTSENTLRKSSRMLSVFTSRGCPYNCIFCHNLFGKKLRVRSASNVAAEIKKLVNDYGAREFEIVDDSFNLDLARAKEIARMLADIPERLHLSFPNGLRADSMDEELLDLLKTAGAYRIDYAVESAVPRIQELMKKRLDIPRAAEIIEKTSSRGILTAGYFMLGFPGETESEMRATVEWALKSKLHIASFFYLNPFPGTPVAESSPELAKRVKDISFSDYSTITVNLSDVPDHVMRDIRRSAYRRFYFSPSRIARNLKDAPKNFRTFMSVIDIMRLSIKDSVNY